MNIWFIAIFENTPLDDNQNTRYNSLVQESLKRGHQVTFWASTFRHNEKKQRYEEETVLSPEKNLTLRYLKSKHYKKNISLKRVFSHRAYASRLISAFEESDELPDLIMMAFPPISVAEKVSAWSQKKEIPCIADIIDPWPDVFGKHLFYLPDMLFFPFRHSVKKTMKRLSAVTAISNQYIDWAKSYNPALCNTKCFYPAVQFRQMQNDLKLAETNVKKSEHFTIIYAGSLGHSYDISTIIGAAEKLEEKCGLVHFIIAGDGPQKNDVEQYEKNHGNLTYVGRVSKKVLMEYYYKADMGLIQHIRGATQSVTYKLFDLLGCGLPILNSLDSEMKEIILNNKVGLHNEPGNVQQLIDNIVYCYENKADFSEMRENAIKLTKDLGDSEKVYAEAITFLESTAS